MLPSNKRRTHIVENLINAAATIRSNTVTFRAKASRQFAYGHFIKLTPKNGIPCIDLQYILRSLPLKPFTDHSSYERLEATDRSPI